MTAESAKQVSGGPRARSRARRLAMQALYQWQLTGDHVRDIARQFLDADDIRRADQEYFQELVRECVSQETVLTQCLLEHLDRPLQQLDPVERAILFIGLYELQQRPDIPYRVIINEGVELAKQFGGEEGHKYVNAVLDKAAARMRTLEYTAARQKAAH